MRPWRWTRALVGGVAPGAPLLARPSPGGAWTRKYFRVELPGGKTAVAMYVPDGVRPEEWVVVNGGQRVRDGATVEPKGVPMPGAAAEQAGQSPKN